MPSSPSTSRTCARPLSRPSTRPWLRAARADAHHGATSPLPLWQVREVRPEPGFAFCKGNVVQIERPNGLLELATIVDAKMDRSNVRSEPLLIAA